MASLLYVIAVPIGNPADITQNAIDILKSIDALICEEYKSGARLLSTIGTKTSLHILNEHSTLADINSLFQKLFIENSGTYGLVSDAGTPCFADPGAELVQLCYSAQIPVRSVPGASSLSAALMLAGKRMERFLYYGFLSANEEKRKKELLHIKNSQTCDYFFLEAPYRLRSLTRDMCATLGQHRKIRLFYKLSYPEEKVFICTLGELLTIAKTLPKGEFILLLEK
ncbi:MAG: SAM-dependent methyltransferase [Candidatus Cloacimonadaceae bacterium]|nr:SAM-dependent methyltransferase [Candidatus Cloacimonadaceae bacterium]